MRMTHPGTLGELLEDLPPAESRIGFTAPFAEDGKSPITDCN